MAIARTARAWAVGIAVTYVVLVALSLVVPPGFPIDINGSWWGPIVVGALFGHAAYSEANMGRVATTLGKRGERSRWSPSRSRARWS
jgi:uncharacterized RDD family membrane protein YckC